MFLILLTWEFSVFFLFVSSNYQLFSVLHWYSNFLVFSFIVYFFRFSWLCLPVLLLEFFFWQPCFPFLKLFLIICYLFRALLCFMKQYFFFFPLWTLIVVFWMFSPAPCMVSLTLKVLSFLHHIYWFTFLSNIFEDFPKCLVFLSCKFMIIRSKVIFKIIFNILFFK